MIRRFCQVDDDAALLIFDAWGEKVEESNLAWSKAVREEQTQKRVAKSEPRCGQCGRPFDTWREAWDHEARAHAMENELFALGH